MRIGFTGEGPTDYGYVKYNQKKCMNEWVWGPAKVLCDRILECSDKNQDDVDYDCIQKEDIKKMKLLRSDLGLSGRAIPARKFYNICKDRKLDGGIFYTDADRQNSSCKTDSEARKHFACVSGEVKQGLKYDSSDGKYIPMIPLKMIENWLLADENSYTKCFGKMPVKNSLPWRPELIWGDESKPESDYPKNYLRRVLLEVSDGEITNNREIFIELAKVIDVEKLLERCDISFSEFYDDFLHMIQ